MTAHNYRATVARPLREQFAVATLLLLIPIGVVMTFAASAATRTQVDLVRSEAAVFARIIAAHIDTTGPEGDSSLKTFFESLSLPGGSQIIVADADGTTPFSYTVASDSETFDPLFAGASVRTRPWTVSVSIPALVAWERAGPGTRRTIAISGMATLILLVMQAALLRRWLPALAKIEQSAARVGEGDLDVRMPGKMPSRELDHLRDAFNDMVAKLRAAREAIALQVEEERRMRMALESLQQQVIRQERLAAIGVLVSGIAHELNNPLQTISGFSELLQHDPRLDAQVRSDLGLVHQESARASAIIRNLSRFGRQQETTPAPVALGDVVASVVELRQRHLHDEGVELRRDERAARPALAVFAELQQVVLNFLINAEQALRAVERSARRIVIRTFDEGDCIHVEVEDSGPGVSPENQTKLFQPFFTTKSIGEGTGLGLSVSYGIIHSHGGEIGYRTGALGGALFYFSVPASGAASR